MSTDIKYLGIPNICFSLSNKDDKREEDFSKQRIERGFDESETWSLRDTIANFIVPRLIAFRNIEVTFPYIFESREEWNDILDKMIKSFQYVGRDKGSFDLTESEYEEYENGMDLFRKYFLYLWW